MSENETAIFQVQDRGIGIPLTEREQVFSSFHRASHVGNISGTGLGLAIGKKSVALHGGKITVDKSVELGIIFTVTLWLNK
jgi:signal transduction histidine kinase